MRALSEPELLSVWERGLRQQPLQRVVTLLAAASPQTPYDDLARLSIGRRDALLLSLREQTFGSRLVGLAACPDCGELAEIELEVPRLLELPHDDAESFVLKSGDWDVRFRLPNSLDLAAIAEFDQVEEARAALLERCLLSVEGAGQPAAPAQLPPEIAAAIAARMAEADPQADLRLACSCPACGHVWDTTLDITSFFWTELATWAKRTMNEIHVLASAYGWRESDILALSPTRRQIYLELIGNEP